MVGALDRTQTEGALVAERSRPARTDRRRFRNVPAGVVDAIFHECDREPRAAGREASDELRIQPVVIEGDVRRLVERAALATEEQRAGRLSGPGAAQHAQPATFEEPGPPPPSRGVLADDKGDRDGRVRGA